MIAYALRSLAGAWEVMNGRPAGLEKLDLTYEGFWRSFAVIVPAIPLDAIILAGDHAVALAARRSVPLISLEDYALHLLAWIVSWLATVALFALLARILGLTSRFVAVIVAVNWSGLLLGGIVAIPYLLFLSGLLPLAAFDWAAVAVVIVVLAFFYLVVRTALAVRPAVAVAALLVWILVTAAVNLLIDPTFAAGAPAIQ